MRSKETGDMMQMVVIHLPEMNGENVRCKKRHGMMAIL